MGEKLEFTHEELVETSKLLSQLRKAIADTLCAGDERTLRRQIIQAINNGKLKRDPFGLHPVLQGLRTAEIAVSEIGLKRDSVLAILLYYNVVSNISTLDSIKAEYGEGVAHIIHGLIKVQELYKKNPVIESENFRNLLVSFSEDMRVILIMIADRVNLMRQIRNTNQKEAQ